MPDPKAEWLAALRAVDDKADLRFNYAVNRWEFLLTCADGVPRSQFWCDFTATREQRVTDSRGVVHVEQVPDRDPVSGLMPYRDLTDASFREALRNLERSFVANPYDGAGTIRRQVMGNYRYNRDLHAQKGREAGHRIADWIWERRRQIRDGGAGPVSGWTPASEPTPAPKILVVSH